MMRKIQRIKAQWIGAVLLLFVLPALGQTAQPSQPDLETRVDSLLKQLSLPASETSQSHFYPLFLNFPDGLDREMAYETRVNWGKRDTMKEYENTLGGPTPNPYSPFSSEIDWELAKWAQLRGPSATSFTELLQINGVRPSHAP